MLVAGVVIYLELVICRWIDSAGKRLHVSKAVQESLEYLLANATRTGDLLLQQHLYRLYFTISSRIMEGRVFVVVHQVHRGPLS